MIDILGVLMDEEMEQRCLLRTASLRQVSEDISCIQSICRFVYHAAKPGLGVEPSFEGKCLVDEQA